jgi:hypothetical protein
MAAKRKEKERIRRRRREGNWPRKREGETIERGGSGRVCVRREKND